MVEYLNFYVKESAPLNPEEIEKLIVSLKEEKNE